MRLDTELKMVLVRDVMMEQGINLSLSMSVRNVISLERAYIMWMKLVTAKEVIAKDLNLNQEVVVNCVGV